MAIKILYANGCSMTEGCELGNTEFNYDEKAHSPFSSRWFFRQNPTAVNLAHMAYMEEHSWPNQLKGLLGIENILNNAQSGSSNPRIARTTIVDVAKLLRTYQPHEILVTIGWSSMGRYEYVGQKTPYRLAQKVPGALTHLHDALPSRDFLLQKERYECDSLMYITTQFLQSVLLLESFLKAHGVPFVFSHGIIEGCEIIWGKQEILNVTKQSELNGLFACVDFSEWVYPPTDAQYTDLHSFLQHSAAVSFMTYARDNHLPQGRGGHPLEQAHRAWAQLVYNQVKDQFKE